jgi:hypothetical protein
MVKICSNLVLTNLLEPKMAASCLAAPKFRQIPSIGETIILFNTKRKLGRVIVVGQFTL